MSERTKQKEPEEIEEQKENKYEIVVWGLERESGGIFQQNWLTKQRRIDKKNTVIKEELDMAVVNGGSQVCLYLSSLCRALCNFFLFLFLLVIL